MAGPIRISILANASNAVSGLKKTETAAQRTAKFIHNGAKIAAAGFVAVGAGALKLAQGAAEDQASAARLANTLKNSAGATKGQVAATEAWITAQGKAVGVSDDELRPSLGALVRATGSVAKGQKLASLAMNISAGTGKSLESVTSALVRAQNGSVGGLSRLGIATKDTAGHTKTFAQIQGELAKKFGGAARTQAETLTGKMKILKVQLSEAGESIGYMLIPALTTAANFIVNNVLPALQRFGGFLKEHKALAITLGGAIAAFGAAFIVASAAMKTYNAVMTIWKVASKGAAAAQWALNAAMSANPIMLVVLAIAALVAIFVIAYKRSEKFRNIVNGAWAAIKKATSATWNFIKALLARVWGWMTGAIRSAFNASKKAVSSAWNAIKSATRSVWNAIKAVVSGAAKAVRAVIRSQINGAKAIVTGAWNAVRKGTSAAWNGIKSVVRNAVSTLLGVVRSIRSRVTGVFSGASRWLYGAGKAIISGLISGVQSLINVVLDKLRWLTSKIPKVKGPLSKDRKLLKPAGQAIIQGLIEGVERQIPGVFRTLGSLTKDIGGFSADLSPTVGIRPAEALAGAGSASGGNVYHINIDARGSVVDEAMLGRKVLSYIKAAERAGVRR